MASYNVPTEVQTISAAAISRTAPSGRAARHEAIRLLDADPDLGALLPDDRRAEAERALVVGTHRLGVGAWDVSRFGGAGGGHIGLLVIEGVLSRELIVADHVSAELLGPGDLVRPWQTPRTGLLPVDAHWWVLSPTTVAVLDRRLAAELTEWPEIIACLFDRLSDRSGRLATTQAISQLTRVDRRLKALFWHLAERWGRVSGDGVVVPLALTHRILGQLVGARRPTVSTALSELAEREELVRRADGSWLLRGDPPDAQTLARRPTAAELRGEDVLRPSRRFAREGDDVESGHLIEAMDRLREALDPGELRELLERRRGATR
jgi:CRP-like cAMP-binding protein